jgi:hypothetical protein
MDFMDGKLNLYGLEGFYGFPGENADVSWGHEPWRRAPAFAGEDVSYQLPVARTQNPGS